MPSPSAGVSFDASDTEQSEPPSETGTTLPMTEAQAQALDSVGISASAISEEQEACFVRVLGQTRVDEVKAGAIPTAAEFFSARGCL